MVPPPPPLMLLHQFLIEIYMTPPFRNFQAAAVAAVAEEPLLGPLAMELSLLFLLAEMVVLVLLIQIQIQFQALGQTALALLAAAAAEAVQPFIVLHHQLKRQRVVQAAMVLLALFTFITRR
jgi:hypothetical protein